MEQTIFAIKCSKCGNPLEFNIITQNYHCAACGSDTPVADITRRAAEQSRAFDAEQSLKLTAAKNTRSVYHCQSCGASVMIAENEMLGQCDFCGTSALKADFSGASFPQGIIPFYITKAEAADIFKKWAVDHKKITHIDEAVEAVDSRLTGYYLPFQMIKGPLRLDFNYESNLYTCGGYLDGIFVSQTDNLDNLVLDAAEPFDTSDLVPFDFSYTAGQRVLMPDLSLDQVVNRAVQETGKVYQPFVADTFKGFYDGFRISERFEKDTNLIFNTVYLPMYVMRLDGCLLVINGQTGRVAIGNNGRINKSMFGFMKRDNSGSVEKEFREFPQYQPKRPLFYQYVTEEIGYNVGIHKMRRVITGYRTELRAGLYEKDFSTGKYVFSTKVAKYANGGAGNDNEIYIGEDFQKEAAQKKKLALIVALVLGLVFVPLIMWTFGKVRHLVNGDLDIGRERSTNATTKVETPEISPSTFYVAFFATPYHVETGEDGKATEADIQFLHIDGKNITLRYKSDFPRFMPKEFLVLRRLDTPNGRWYIQADFHFNKGVRHGGHVIVRPTETALFYVYSEEIDAVSKDWKAYKRFYGVLGETLDHVPINYYEPE